MNHIPGDGFIKSLGKILKMCDIGFFYNNICIASNGRISYYDASECAYGYFDYDKNIVINPILEEYSDTNIDKLQFSQ